MSCVIEAMDWQIDFITCAVRFIALFAGRRAGKTDAIKARIKKRTEIPFFKYLYIAPLSFQALIVFRELLADLSWRPYIKSFAQRPYPTITLHNGATIVFRSFQRSENIRSTGENEICIDESQDPKITEYAFDTVIIPMLADFRGTLVMAGQFRGEDWRDERFFVPGQQFIDGKPNPRWTPRTHKSWQVPSAMGYVFQAPGGIEELALLEATLPPAVFEQEILCKRRSNANAVFPMEWLDAIIRVSLSDEEKTKLKSGNTCGVDMGRIVDPTKVVVINRSGTVIHAEAFPLKQEHAVSARNAARIAAQYNAAMVVDATGGATGGHAEKDSYVKLYRECADALRINMHEFFWSMQNKKRIIDQMALAVQQKHISIPCNFDGLIKELKAYEYRFNENTKQYVYGAPRGQHDDYVSALAMAIEGMKRGWNGSGDRSGIGAFVN